MKRICLLILALFFITACSPITEKSMPTEFVRTTVSEVLANPAQFDGKNVVIEAKKQKIWENDFGHRFKIYDLDTGLLMRDIEHDYTAYDDDEPVVIGDESKLIVLDYNKVWRWIPEEMWNNPYTIRETSAMRDNFFEDVFMDFYGTIRLEPACACSHDEFGRVYVDDPGVLTENIPKIECESPALECTGVWRHELDVPKRTCDRSAAEVKEKMVEFAEDDDPYIYGRYVTEINDYTGEYFLKDGELRDPNWKTVEHDGLDYYFPTFFCKTGSESSVPVMEFLDAKLKNSSEGIFDLKQVACFDIGPIKNTPGRNLAKCKDREYAEI